MRSRPLGLRRGLGGGFGVLASGNFTHSAKHGETVVSPRSTRPIHAEASLCRGETLVTVQGIRRILITTLWCKSLSTRYGSRVSATHNLRNAESQQVCTTRYENIKIAHGISLPINLIKIQLTALLVLISSNHHRIVKICFILFK